MYYDGEELLKFVSLLPPLYSDQVWFVSLSARKKYISEKEASEINLNRAEMFNRQIIRSTEKFSHVIQRLSAEGYYTKDGHPYPEKSIVTYFNINPTSMINAYAKFTKQVTNLLAELSLKEGPIAEHTLTQIKKLDVLFMNHVQQQRSIKNFIDIDVDTKDKKVLQTLLNELKNNNASCLVVSTHGGYHVLIYRNTINFNYHEIVAKCNSMTSKEVIVNPNEMIPLPGTMQGNHLVKLL